MFRKIKLFSYLALALLVLGFEYWISALPDRADAPLRLAEVRYQPVGLDPSGFVPLKLAGAWRIDVDDPRFGGISALAIDDDRLVALTDSGTVAHLPRPGSGRSRAWVRDLADGPGDPAFKSNRDSEALLRDPRGRGWWVAFENRDQLWLFDRWFRRVLARVDLSGQRWRTNTGIEGLAADGAALLAFPEGGDAIVRIAPGSVAARALDQGFGRISDAVRLPDGRLLLLGRHPTPAGFANRLLVMEDGRPRELARLRLGALENAEGLAAEPLRGGGTRIWLITDNGLRRRLPTLLVALDIPPPLREGGI